MPFKSSFNSTYNHRQIKFQFNCPTTFVSNFTSAQQPLQNEYHLNPSIFFKSSFGSTHQLLYHQSYVLWTVQLLFSKPSKLHYSFASPMKHFSKRLSRKVVIFASDHGFILKYFWNLSSSAHIASRIVFPGIYISNYAIFLKKFLKKNSICNYWHTVDCSYFLLTVAKL